MTDEYVLVAGRSNPELAKKIAEYLNKPLFPVDILQFKDGEIQVYFNDTIRGKNVIIISHSISQIIDSDIIYAMKEGRVEQGGDPDEVYKQGGIYKEILDASARSLNIEKIARTIEEGSAES